MANNIALSKKYVPLLDEVYKNASLTAHLDSDATLAREGANVNEIIIPKLAMDGLGDYDRNSGYTQGNVSLSWETVKFNYERGRKFSVDAMDNQESQDVAFGRLAGEFVRTKVVPEIDAFRFASYAGQAGITTKAGAIADGATLITELITAVAKMDDDEVPQEDRHLFLTPTLHGAIMALDTTKSREVLAGFTSITKVPQSRFYTAIELKDGKTAGEEAGGYAKATGAKDINFMIIHKGASIQFPKHVVPKIISPDQNQDADAWIYGYRNYGICEVYENKVAGVYVHTKA